MHRLVGWALVALGLVVCLLAMLLLTNDYRPKLALAALGSCVLAAGTVQLIRNRPN